MKAGDKINILLVDDRPENLLALEAVLSSSEYNLVKVTSGESALKSLLKHDFALILLDVQMPNMDGFETAKLIKERERSKDIPIIFITAINKEPEQVFTGYSIGAIDYMFKPFDPDTLKGKVDAFAMIFMKQRQLEQQSELLRAQTEELERAYAELTATSMVLQKTEALTRVISETSMDTMITFNTEGCILTANPAVEKMFGYQPDDLFGENVMKLVPYLKNVLNGIQTPEQMDLQTGIIIEALGFHVDGNSFSIEIHFGETYIFNEHVFACTIRDITERKVRLAELQHKAFHDDLTGLPNRSMLYNRLQQFIAENLLENNSLSLILLDLDHFKSINDTLGHHVGDDLLQQIAQRLLTAVHAGDTVARLGGDEFSVMIPRQSAIDVIPMVEKIIKILDEPFFLQGNTMSVRPSIGVVSFPQHGSDVDTLLRRADMAMYAAKRNYTEYSIFYEGLEKEAVNQGLLMGELRKAVHQGSFKLAFQPKVKMPTYEIESVETLIRWEHPHFGFISPDEFIPLAERMGLIKQITTWVLKESFIQLQIWKRNKLDFRISVNVSARDLQDIEFPDRVLSIMNEYEILPNQLVLEITESAIMEDPERAMLVLIRLGDMGIRVAIDDFGKGYSSLAYLKNLPVHELKIDKSFVMKLSLNQSDEMIVRSVINLAHNLGLTVVAEGVEDQEVLDKLQFLGCDTVQGYYISRPLSPEDLAHFVTLRYKQNL